MSRYRHWLPWLALLVAAIALVACSGSSTKTQDAAGPKANGPRIAVPEESFDFGKVPLDKMVSHSFVIKNVGTENLTFLGRPQVRAVQGC